ncbi:MAG: response regulator transcription factor [Cyanobacteria bacterium SZAS TMP-1]|nr:response regulator transcription factor [Cyanobacteria bacterium SZAS TMP-1]
MLKILLVEDDKDIADMISQWMEAENCSVEVTHDGLAGYEFLRLGSFDVAILDWNLPGMNGIDILKKYRANGGSIPILLLTAQNLIENKVAGFDAGVDDYLTKPFHILELHSRVKSLARRPKEVVSDIIRIKNLELDRGNYRLTKDGEPIHLQRRDFELLEFLMAHPKETFSTESLLQRLWGLSAETSAGTIRTTIRRIRQALGESADDDNSIIENVRRVGYRIRS